MTGNVPLSVLCTTHRRAAEVDAVPERTRLLAKDRREALRRFIDAGGGNVHEVARPLSWAATAAYRMANGDTTTSRKARVRGSEG